MAEARKTVTVVFADVTGSTELGEQLDPEALRSVMERYFTTARAALERHEGTVEKFIGDAVVAVFGIPTAHEDDALRAVRAAAEMREALAVLNEEFSRERGLTLAVRTGVNTGEVVAGDPTQGQFYATGDTVNVAARLEQAAAPGEILLGEKTYRLVRDAVRAESVEPLALKGKAETVPAWRLCAVVEGAAPFARRLDTPFIGRGEELARLIGCFQRSLAEQAPVLVTVLGPAGIGKTRLATEFSARASEQGRVLTGRCLSYGEGITFWPLQEILRSLRERPAGLPDPEQARSIEETFWAYRKLFEALAAKRPLVLIVEDVHWAEPSLLDLVEHVVEWTRDAPMVILCLARPELLDERPGWPGERFELEPLPSEEAEAIVTALAGQLDLGTRARLTEVAEGNPLFLEQLLVLAAEGNGRELALPHTIQALLSARLDRLEAEERVLLERAAVVGKEFWRGALLHLSPPGTEVSVLLQRLVRRRLISPERSSFPGEDAFRFGHILIRDAAYGGIPKRVRTDLHERFADWLEASGSPYEELVGYHLEQASHYRRDLEPADPRALDLAVRAADRLSVAGRRALRRGDVGAAVNLLGRAVTLYPPHRRDRQELLSELGFALFDAGDLARADAVLTEAIESARAAGDRSAELHARSVLLHWRMFSQPRNVDLDVLATEAHEAIEAFERDSDHLGLARAWKLMSEVWWQQGRIASAVEAYEHLIKHARRADNPYEETWGFANVAFALVDGPTPISQGLPRLQELLEQARGGMHEVAVLAAIGALEAMLGRLEDARGKIAQARETASDLGARWYVGLLDLWSSRVELLGRNPAAAERDLREAATIFGAMGEWWFRSLVAIDLAHLLLDEGRREDAAEAVRELGDEAASFDPEWKIKSRTLQAKELALEGRLDEAVVLASEAFEVGKPTDSLNHRAEAGVIQAQILAQAGRSGAATVALRDALSLYERKENVAAAAQARAALANVTSR